MNNSGFLKFFAIKIYWYCGYLYFCWLMEKELLF